LPTVRKLITFLKIFGPSLKSMRYLGAVYKILKNSLNLSDPTPMRDTAVGAVVGTVMSTRLEVKHEYK
jgi:hypothetical protein